MSLATEEILSLLSDADFTRADLYTIIDVLYDRAKVQPIDATTGAYYCRDCGSMDVQGTAWVALNENSRDVGSDPPDEDGWCEDCGMRDAFHSETPPLFCACTVDAEYADDPDQPMATWTHEADGATTCPACKAAYTTIRPEPTKGA